MSKRMTKDNQVPVSLQEEIEIMIAVGGLSPAQAAISRKAADRIAELEARLTIEHECNRCHQYHGKEPCADVKELEEQLAGMKLAYEICKDPALEAVPHGS